MKETILFKLDDIDTLIWDWNGTLLDDVDVNLKVVNKMLSSRYLDQLDLKVYKNLFCFPVQTFHEQIGFDFEKESIEEISVEYHALYQEYEHNIRLNADTRYILDKLNNKGIKQYILSASGKSELLKIIDRFELSDKFEGIYGADNICATGKAGVGKYLITDNSIDPGKTLLIGDTMHDAEVAKTLGVNYILYSGGHNSHDLLAKGSKVITDLKEILSL